MFFKMGVLKLLAQRTASFIQIETPTQVFSCEYHMIFKNSFFMEQLWWLLLKMVKEEISNPTLKSFVTERFELT